MSVLRQLLLTALAGSLFASTARAEAGSSPGLTTYVDLLTMAPGSHLFQRFGHTALMVMRTREGQKRFESRVYNFGDADFEAPGFDLDFLRGRARFRLIRSGDLAETVGIYAAEDRTIYHQRLNLTAAEVQRLEERLAWMDHPERRDYPYHFLSSSCATKARDVLDEVLGGEIRKQLDGVTDPGTVRDYGHKGYAGHLLGELFNDLCMGRLMDLPRSRYFSLYLPQLMMDYLQQVRVRDPRGGDRRVPLAEPPTVLYQRQGRTPASGDGRSLERLAYALAALLLGVGALAFIRAPGRPRLAGVWLILWSLPCGLAALLIALLALGSSVPEVRQNELLVVLPATDVALWAVAWRWYRRVGVAGRLLRGYATVRLVLCALALVGHAGGLLFQQPRSMLLLSTVAALGLWLLSRRFPRASSDRRLTSLAATEAAPTSR